MSRRHALVTLIVAVVLTGCTNPAGTGSVAPSAAATSSAASPSATAGEPSAKASVEPVTLTIVSTSKGNALAGANGMMLYTNSEEGSGTIACTGPCATTWPPLTGTVTAGSSLVYPLATITRPDGSIQTTYNGYPLYYYAFDDTPGIAKGQGFGGIWFAALASGEHPR